MDVLYNCGEIVHVCVKGDSAMSSNDSKVPIMYPASITATEGVGKDGDDDGSKFATPFVFNTPLLESVVAYLGDS